MVEYCQKSAEFNQKTYSELQGGSEDKKSQAKKEKPKKAAAPKPKKEPKEEEVPEELDAAELILAAEPKSSNPFDALPKGYVLLSNLSVNFVYSGLLLFILIAHSIWTISKKSTVMKKSPNQLLTSGSTLIRKIIQSGLENTSIIMSYKKYS